MWPAVPQTAVKPWFTDFKIALFLKTEGILSAWKNTKLKIIVGSAVTVTTSFKEMRPNCSVLFYPVLWSVGAICGWSLTLCLSRCVRALRDFSISAWPWFLLGNDAKNKEELVCNHAYNAQPVRSPADFWLRCSREPWRGWLTPSFPWQPQLIHCRCCNMCFPTLGGWGGVGWAEAAQHQTREEHPRKRKKIHSLKNRSITNSLD